jgi:hypothetical protein
MSQRMIRRVIRIRGSDSPNVRYAEAEIAAGKKPSHRILVPGVLPYADYLKRISTWSEIRVCIGIHALFWEGKEVLLYPPDWLARAERIAREVTSSRIRRIGKGLGVDPAEGGDKTAWCVVDEWGILELISKKTPNTAVIPNETLALARRYGVKFEDIVFDAGGGGVQHANTLRELAYPVRTVAFGEGVTLEPKRGMRLHSEKIDLRSERQGYTNRRAEMYGDLRELLDPSYEALIDPRNYGKVPHGFGIPEEYSELIFQLSPIPLLYDKEGRLRMLPKNRVGAAGPNSEKTLVELIGHSPDEADSLVLAVHAMLHKPARVVAGVGR